MQSALSPSTIFTMNFFCSTIISSTITTIATSPQPIIVDSSTPHPPQPIIVDSSTPHPPQPIPYSPQDLELYIFLQHLPNLTIEGMLHSLIHITLSNMTSSLESFNILLFHCNCCLRECPFFLW
jgi:hypothetical protein